MPAAYDSYDYPSYWAERKYEHKSEIFAIKSLLVEIPKINVVLDIGAGYGRITSVYYHRAHKIILVDPSAKLLKLARQTFNESKVKFIQSSIENLNGKVKKGSVDLVLLIRVIHHLKNLEEAFRIITKVCKKNAYFILEYPNKRHIKATLSNFLKGNLTFPLDIFPKDLSSKKSLKSGSLPFNNYHPDFIKELLSEYGFKIVRTISVSNFRYSWFKENFPLETVLFFEKIFQKIISPINFGPSIFILAQKVK